MTGSQRRRLCSALTAAFEDEDELAMMVSFGLNRKLNAFVAPGPLLNRVFELVDKCETRGWLNDLLLAAREENPGNRDLELIVLELAQEQDLDGKLPPEGELQRIVVEHSRFQDPEEWLLSMAACLKTICRVESAKETPQGTGFLVGPSLVITNHHVVTTFANGGDPIFRFDYRATKDGKRLRAGKEYKLKAANWLKAHSPEGELDYALVELKGAPGEDSPGQGVKAQPRGWLKPLDYGFQKGEPLVIVQHPAGRYLELAFGSIMGPGAKRVTHSVSTQGGSSGSPCFNSSLDLVALHYWGSDAKNAAIPFTAILNHMGDARQLLGG